MFSWLRQRLCRHRFHSTGQQWQQGFQVECRKCHLRDIWCYQCAASCEVCT